MSTSIVGRWGKSLAIRLPSDVAARLSLAQGVPVEVEQRADEIVIRRAKQPPSLDDLFRGRSPAEWRAIYREHVVDWGPDVGREIIDE